MSETVVSVQAMTDILMNLVKTKMVKIREANGVVTLIPIKEQEECSLYGFLGEGKFSTERYFEQKRLDKELEEG